MTPQQVLDASRNNLNALNDTFWTDTELLTKLYETMLQMSRETQCIEASTTITSVAGTQAYSRPTKAPEIWRVEFASAKLQLIDYRQRDQITFNDPTGQSGTPRYYLLYGDVITLYPTPVTAETITIYYYGEPAVPTASSTLEIPSIFHDALVSGLTARMTPKDLAHPLTAFWRDKWAVDLDSVRTYLKRRKRGDRFNIVNTEEVNLTTNFGIT